MGTPWRGGGYRRRWQTSSVIIAVLVALIVIVAVTKGVQNRVLSLADVILFAVAVPSIIFHEVSHGVVALWCGDDTAKRAGRLSANPMRHVDPIGSVVLPVILVLLHAPVFGWAKPVPVAYNRLRHPRNQAVLVGLAGPASNALVAAVAGFGAHMAMASQNLYARSVTAASIANLNTSEYHGHGTLFWIGAILGFLGLVNVFIGAFNLIPIPPLDGSALLERFIPVQALPAYYRIRIGFLIVIAFLVFFDGGLLTSIYDHVATWYLGLVVPGGF